MRTYPLNSPQAAARIVALAMLSDGQPSELEFEVLERLRAASRIGLRSADWHAVVQACCEDLLASNPLSWDQGFRVDRRTLAQFLAEIDDPALRCDVASICCAVIEADDWVTLDEWFVLSSAFRHWELRPELLSRP
jgi:hypothetical protein